MLKSGATLTVGWWRNCVNNDPSILITNQYGLVSSNVYVGTVTMTGSPWSAHDFKYVVQPGTIWDSVSAVNADGGGNRWWASNPNNDYNLVLPVVNFSDNPYAPLSTVSFSVDMSVQAYYSNWDNTMPPNIAGSMNGWNAGAANLTNDPSSSNPNVYSGSFILGQGSTAYYKFTYPGNSGTVWENPKPPTSGGNRFFVVPLGSTASVAPVLFSDLQINDLLSTNTLVTFQR